MSKPFTLAEEEIVFYYYLGQAIGAWAFVEVSVRNVALACFDDDLTRRAVAVGFVSIDGFKAKMDFAERLVSRRFTAQVEEWAELVKTARALSQQRNKLAHRGAALYELSEPGRRYVLSPWVYTKKKPQREPKRPIPPDGCMAVRDIVKCDIELTHCGMRLANFAARLEGQPEPYEATHKPPIRPPTVARLRALIHEGLGV